MCLALLVDPFWVRPCDVADMTDREMWEDYIRPAMIAQRRDGGQVEGGTDEDEYALRDRNGRIISPEEAMYMLAGAGVADPKQVAETVAKSKAAD